MKTQNKSNPFQFGLPIRDPQAFVGRRGLLEGVVSSMSELQNVSLRGERRTGKTSLLLQLLAHPSSRIPLSADHILVYFDFQQVAEHGGADLWWSLAKAVADQVERQHNELPRAAGGFLSALRKSSGLDRRSLSGTDFARSLARLVDTGLIIHLLFDEFEHTKSYVDAGILYDTLRSLPTRVERLSYVIATRVGLAALDPEYKTVSSPFFNIFSTHVLKPFDEDEVYELLYTYMSRAGSSPSTAEALCADSAFLHEVTGYHPFFLQMYCYHLYEGMGKPGWPAGPARHDAMHAFRKEAESHLQFFWDVSSEEERDLMAKLAAGQEVDWRLFAAARASLYDRCLIVPFKSAWRLFSCAFSEWIAERRRIVGAREIGLTNQVRRDLIEVLSGLPQMQTRAGRDAWLMNLPGGVRDLIVRRDEHHKVDMAFLIDALQGMQMADGRSPIVMLIDAVLKEIKGLSYAQTLEQLRDQIRAQLAGIEFAGREAPTAKPARTRQPAVKLSDPLQNRKQWLELVRLSPDPFLFTHGAEDPNLSRYFYRVPKYVDIMGDASRLETVFVFGADGSGKSSLRNAIAQDCRAQGILAIIWEDLDPLKRRLDEVETIRPEEYVSQALGVGIAALAEQVSEGWVSLPPHGQLSRVARDCLWSYVLSYERDPVTRLALQAFLNPSSVQELPTDNRQLLGNFCRYSTMLFGYAGVYFLVDPRGDVSPDIELAWRVLAPLLSEQGLVDLGRYKGTFKFFLSSAFLPRVLEIPWIAREQASRVFQPLEWSAHELRALLRERLRQCSLKEPPYVSLGELSELDNLDDLVINRSGNRPRELIALCNSLFNEHCHSHVASDRVLITAEDVERAVTGLLVRQPESLVGRLVASGESSFVEIKSTLRFNLHSQQVDKRLEQRIAETLCGFMNADGGTLIIGVDDKGEAVGLRDDLSTLAKKDEDGFELALTDIVTTYLGPGYLQYTAVRFEEYRGERVCVVKVERSPAPVFCRIGEDHEFHVRLGNSTRRLDAKAALQYIRDCFE